MFKSSFFFQFYTFLSVQMDVYEWTREKFEFLLKKLESSAVDSVDMFSDEPGESLCFLCTFLWVFHRIAVGRFISDLEYIWWSYELEATSYHSKVACCTMDELEGNRRWCYWKENVLATNSRMSAAATSVLDKEEEQKWEYKESETSEIQVCSFFGLHLQIDVVSLDS